MNLDKEQQQQQQLPLLPLQQQQQQQYQYHLHPQHQQQQTTSMALMSSGEYVNFKPINTIATSNESAPLSTTISATAMTICMDLPTPPLSETVLTPFSAVVTTSTNPTTSTTTMQLPQTTATFETMGVMTSSFKTPLLPMPTLDDIEGGVIYEQQQQQQQQHHQQLQPLQQQIIQSAHIPTGILKYPTITTAATTSTPTPASATTTPILITQQQAAAIHAKTLLHTPRRSAAELNLPLGLIMDCTSSTIVSHDGDAQTTTAPTAAIGATRHKYSILKTTADINNRSISSSCASEIPISDVYNGIVKTPPAPPAPPPSPPPTTTTATITPAAGTTSHGLRLKSSATAATSASTAKLSQSSGCCCACFRNKRHDAHSSSDAKIRKTKRKTQTLWSAFIMNVGICTLLLAYTFLGKCINTPTRLPPSGILLDFLTERTCSSEFMRIKRCHAVQVQS